MSVSAVPVVAHVAGDTSPVEKVDLRREFNEVGIGEVLDQLDLLKSLTIE